MAHLILGNEDPSQPTDGGYVVTPEMRRIMATEGYISLQQGSQRLRNLYQDNAKNFDVNRFSPLALACFCGRAGEVKAAMELGWSPDLNAAETPYKLGYCALVILGAQRIHSGPPGTDHTELLKYLLRSGAPPDVEDIAGYTALNHATMNYGSKVDLARILLENGANPNHRTRYGAVPILDSMQSAQIECIELLMEFGADLDIPDADGVLPSQFFVGAGPKIAAVVSKWLRKRSGEDAPLDEKKCKTCGKTEGSLKQCGKCHIVKYCSAECQRQDWRTHKQTCRPFGHTNTVTLKPSYNTYGNLIPTSDFTRRAMGIPTEPTPERNTRGSHAPKTSAYPKSVIIKVQVPYAGPGITAVSTGDLLIYTKKRDFVCTIEYNNNRDGHRRVSEVVRDKGLGGAKAYFAAELKSKDELVVKVDEVLAAQPF
ncbi:ankyrin repeat-containing domain protein [Cristinia sonorae]|uniref:Ankyrin repeat-containing domain protein n=1 Tax=Cristinia sonorae TaxID=1940300 RepID=A0A8K0UJB3_9AGAR|nr:ankyrin repeat-containing domain protein [Cristinia sonorae]